MKVTVLNGSPRGRKSNSHIIVEAFLEGAKQAGAEAEEVFLSERNIKHCLGCFTCWNKTPGKCAIDDDMESLIKLFLEAAYVGLATPIYGMFMTGLLKNVTDRLLPLATPHIHRNEDGSFYHEGRVQRLPKQFFIANSGFPGEHNFDFLKLFNSIAKESGQNIVLEIYRNCGEALQTSKDASPQLIQNVAGFKEALKKAGWELITYGEVSHETIELLHMELISDEEYMSDANQYWDESINRVE